MLSDSDARPKLQTALIAGCGYVGQRVAKFWLASGIETFAISRDAEKSARFSAEGIYPLVMDLSSPETWPELPVVDVLLWSVGFDRSAGAERTRVWVDGLRELLTRVRFRNNHCRVIYTSSTGVYGDSGGEEVDEETKASPDTESGKACLGAEQVLTEYSIRTGHPTTVLRLAGIYGPDRLLRRITDLQNGTPFLSPPDDWLNLVHVDDIVRVIDTVANLSSTAKIPLMNVVAAHSVTRRMYYTTLAELALAPEPVFEMPSTADTRKYSGRSSSNRRIVSRIRPILNISFQFDDIRAGLRDAIKRSS